MPTRATQVAEVTASAALFRVYGFRVEGLWCRDPPRKNKEAGTLWGLCRDNGKENGSYYSIIGYSNPQPARKMKTPTVSVALLYTGEGVGCRGQHYTGTVKKNM